MHDPRALLGERLAARRTTVAALERRDARIAGWRLAAFLALAAIAGLAFTRRAAWGWALAPGAAFLGLVVLHGRALEALARARRAVRFHEDALARADLAHAGTGDAGERYAPEDHPYAQDLDLFGRGALFELLCAARTRPGADALAAMLLAPAAAGEVRARQAAVADLAPRLDLREDLAVAGEDVRSEVDAERLAAWGEAPRAMPRWPAAPAALLGAASMAALVGWFAGVVPGVAFAALVLADWMFLRLLKVPIAHVLAGVERPAAELEVLSALLARVEREPFRAPKLTALRGALGAGPGAALGQGRGTASHRIAQLARTVDRAAWAENQLFAPVAFLLLWRVHGSLAVERWRAEYGRALRGWLQATGELEALASLAGHAFLHPEDPYPELDDGGARYEAEGLGHPLLPEDRCVRNDVRLGEGARLLVVSGSNMSGKSTLLRTIGANAVLALAGAPVRARRLRLSPLRLGATLRIQDSLAEGRSRFFAEITRLRQVLDLASGAPPALFLLDELLAGTNSRDRRIGSEAVLRSLLGRGAIGLVTTHDLALAELADAIPGAENAHFEDELRDGAVAF
ncbi:MAG: MutS-related protein, partial [Anaeromyxobacteraceae bacterium]